MSVLLKNYSNKSLADSQARIALKKYRGTCGSSNPTYLNSIINLEFETKESLI